MAKTPFIWLGAGRAGKRGAGRRGRLLDQVAGARLPVPDGAILLDELYHLLLREGVLQAAGEQVRVPDPVWLWEVLYRDVRLPRLRRVADFSPLGIDGANGEPPPEMVTRGVDLEEATAVAGALGRAWSLPAAHDTPRRDVLLLAQVAAGASGGAHLPAGDGPHLIEAALDGQETRFELPPLERWKRPPADLPPYAQRLQKLLRGVRRTLGEGEWRLTWADDGDICWVTGVS